MDINIQFEKTYYHLNSQTLTDYELDEDGLIVAD
jgi:hypothetical protein